MSATVTRDAEGTVTGNTYDKYGSTNPVVRRLMGTFERVRRIELQLGVEPSHYEPGAQPTGHAKTTGASAGGATGKTEEREALHL